MLIAPDAFWNRLEEAEKQAIAETLQAWAGTHTLSHNWRWFNVMMQTFLAVHGYEVDRDLMRNHIDHLLLHHAGDGWYRDTSYDYYTAHVFHLYGAIWVRHYAREHEPERAAIIDSHFKAFEQHYAPIFGREGTVNMYGRSILYRLGASAGMAASQLGDQPSQHITPGQARRVASGALLQFTTHPDFFNQGIPSLGFYGPFPPAIQSYSCSASPYWMFLNFTCLTLPEEHPFWSDNEDAGHWGELAEGDLLNEHWDGPGFLVSNHGTSGASEIRPGKIHNTDPNYSRLVYSTAFPWEANATDGIHAGAISFGRNRGAPALPRTVSLAGFRDRVLYRQAEFAAHLPPFIDMATVIIPDGEIRIERVRRLLPCNIYLGHFGLPHMDGDPTVETREIDGHPCVQAAIPGRQLAMTAYMGWDNIEHVSREGLHPEAQHSTLIYAAFRDEDRFGPAQLLISVLLHKTDDTPWTDEQLQPIASVTPLHEGTLMHMSGLRIELHNGETYTVDFGDIDGTSSVR